MDPGSTENATSNAAATSVSPPMQAILGLFSAIALGAALVVARQARWSVGAADAVYFGAIAALVGARLLTLRRKVAGLRRFRRFALVVALMAVVVWAGAQSLEVGSP